MEVNNFPGFFSMRSGTENCLDELINEIYH